MKKAIHGFRILSCMCICMLFIACDSDINILPFWGSNGIKSDEFYHHMLEKFCQEHYDDLYKDYLGKREYEAGSLRIDSIRSAGEREVNVYGKHNFKRRIIHLEYLECTDRNFKANIYETKKNSNVYIITFEKESERFITRKSYTETRTKQFYYEE